MKKVFRVWISCLCNTYDINSSEVRLGELACKVRYDKGGK